MKDCQEAVREYIEAANALRLYADIEIGFALVDCMREMPIKTYYAVTVPAGIFAQQVKDRLPEV